MDKVPPSARFVDFSDYTRPLAMTIARALLPTPVAPVHVTLAFILVGVAAGALLAAGRLIPLAGALLLVKATLDGVDGSLARARRRPSRVGRFLDSIGDFVVNLMVYFGIGWRWALDAHSFWPLAVAAVGLISGMLQVSLYNHYFVLYRHAVGGDPTSRSDESAPDGQPWDHPLALRVTLAIYRWIYGWQDRLVAGLDRRIAPNADTPHPGFLSATTILGLGMQLAVIAACAFAGEPRLSLVLILTLFNLHAVALLARRAGTSRRLGRLAR